MVLILIQLISACCRKKDSNSGEIEAEITIENTGPPGLGCLIIADTFCIRTDSVYRNFFKQDTNRKNCPVLDLPFIDFNKHTLLGNFRSGRRDFYHRKVNINHDDRIVTYEITKTSCSCADVCFRASYNMVLIPKLGKDYRVIFR